MTESFKRKAGEYQLEYMNLYKFRQPDEFIEISSLVHHWKLVETINAGHIQGSIQIYDSVALLDQFIDGAEDGWLRGEEEIEIAYTDFFGETRVEKYFIYAITDVSSVKRGNEAIYSYVMHFTSIEKFIINNIEVKRGFRDGKISEYVEEIFNEYYESEKPLTIEPTENTLNLLVPNYDPEDTMHFFSRKAASGSESAVPTYRFFENREGFFFKTYESMILEHDFDLDGQSGKAIQQLPIFVREEEADQTPEGQIKLMSTLIDISFPRHVNTIEDMNEGAYWSRTTELDFLNRTITFNDYRYLDEYQNYRFADNENRSKHSKSFVDTYITNPRDTLVVKDYSDDALSPFLRRSPNYPTAYNQKNVSLYHYEQEEISMSIRGRNTLNAGDIIELRLYDVNYAVEDRELDKKRSGRYIVISAESIFHENTYKQNLIISKAGFQEKPEKARDYVRQTNSTYTETGSSKGVGEVNPPKQVGSRFKPDPTRFTSTTKEGKAAAEEFLGRPMTDQEYNSLVAATFAEAGRDSTEEAYIAGTILNRARATNQTVTEILNQPRQFTAVTGTSVNSAPSKNYVNGPPRNIEDNINGSLSTKLATIPKDNFYFNSASRRAVQAGERYVTVRNGVRGELVGNSFVYPGATWP